MTNTTHKLLEQLVTANFLLLEASVDLTALASQGLALYTGDDGTTKDFVLYKPQPLLELVQKAPDILSKKELLSKYASTIVVGFLQITNEKVSSCGAWTVVYSSAQKGYGPVLYDIAMSDISPDYLSSDRNKVSPLARNVWDYYLNNRSSEFNIRNMPEEEQCQFADDYELGKNKSLNVAFAIKNKLNPSGLVQANNQVLQTIQRTNPTLARQVETLFVGLGFRFYSSLSQQPR